MKATKVQLADDVWRYEGAANGCWAEARLTEDADVEVWPVLEEGVRGVELRLPDGTIVAAQHSYS